MNSQPALKFSDMDEFLRDIGVGQRSPHDPFFDEALKTCKIFTRKGVTIVDDEELCHEAIKEFSCNVPGCTATFQTLIDFETHYNGSHRYICLECKKCRPSARLLDIHVQETHDSFFKVLAERQPMYQCYVSECDVKLKTLAERKEHCITVHQYPKNFRFDQTSRRKDKGDSGNQMEVDGGTQLPKQKKSVTRLNKNQKSRTFYSEKMAYPHTKNVPTEPTSSNVETPPPPTLRSALCFVPRQVKSYSKLLTKTDGIEKDVLNNGCMMDLAEALPD
ncbi:zinc finger protein 511 [Athalia rosae]|uniref:zinc finger protein 511 n=1 Tax=Athalia rosae TaxID=37344 RepID=UPI0020348D30|nr:zinc finger protein 511 [Athalia rosae]